MKFSITREQLQRVSSTSPAATWSDAPFCGGQLISCGCATKHFYPEYDRDGFGLRRWSTIEREHARHCLDPQCVRCDELIEHGFTNGLPVRVYFDGLSDEQEAEFDRHLQRRGRIPFIVYPNMCCRCGTLWPDMFSVPCFEWRRYVDPAHRSEMLCRTCYDWIRKSIDDAANAAKES